ncbi:MAG: tetratricopeptide repeat protein [Flavobacteriaceae bacterium]|nr:tetratricopeptide repeat protein [Flavobacteriaceae bacterium]
MKFVLKILFLVFTSTTIFSQDLDSTLIRLKKNVEEASGTEAKIKALLAVGGYDVKREFNQAEYYFLEAEKLSEKCKLHKDEHLALIYFQLGVVDRRKGNYDEAISFYLKSKKIHEDLQSDISILADLVHNIGIIYRYQKDNKKAIHNFKEAVKINLKKKDTFRIAASYNMIGVSFRKLNKLDSALIYYDKAKSLFKKIKRNVDVRRVNNNLSTLYAVQKKYDKSIPIKLENLAYYKNVGNKMSASVAYYNLSRDYSSLGYFSKSLKYADSSLNIALQEGFKERISRTYLRKSIVYRRMSNYKEAYENYVNYKRYSDSIYNIESVKRIQKLELEYEFEKEKKELETFSNESESRVKLYVFLFILALIVGTIVGYLLYRNYTTRVRIVRDKLEKAKLKKELLNQKIKVSESELKYLIADNSMRLQFVRELTENIKEDKKETDSKDIQRYTQSLILKLQQQIATEDKLSSIQERIEEVNIGFSSKLMDLYPSLTKTEREVCSLLRLNLSIKEIASIRNASTDAVKAVRYRIRKKLKVPNNIELEHFVQSL